MRMIDFENMEALAEGIARSAHAGQKDKQGNDYIHHVERVVALVTTPQQRAVAWLHDVLEDCPDVSASRLLRVGIPPNIVISVIRLTRDPDVAYQDYIDSLIESCDHVAQAVKLADLRDHLRPGCPERLRPRYMAALAALERMTP